jgi:triosephosphate isomerase
MATSMRKRFLIGNWKMYKNISQSLDYAKILLESTPSTSIEIGLAVPYISIAPLREALKGSKILVGAQNMHDAAEGAFTGEISTSMLLDIGAQFVILGHSERRHLFGEDNAFVNRKVKRALEANLLPIVCIGETLEQREQGITADVLREQLMRSLADLTESQISRIAIAYEPVWAIGTGKTATAEQAQAEQAFCRKCIAQQWGASTAERLSILYGGSVKPDNAAALMEQIDVDGLLVGGASLDPKNFSEIANRINQW